MGLCTHATPVAVLAAMPSCRDLGAAFRLRKRLASPYLPQGAPTSPQLANLSEFRLDRRLATYGAAIGAVYTRYGDDLTFSGSGLRAGAVIGTVRRIVTEEGFAVNLRKTRVRRPDNRQQVTGVVVNERTTAPREQRNLLSYRAQLCGAWTGRPEQVWPP